MSRFAIALLLPLLAGLPSLAAEWKVVVIEVNAPGTALELEQSVTRPIERAVSTLAGLKQLKSWTRDGGQARVELTFFKDPSPDNVLQVGRAFASVRGLLPTSAAEPVIDVQTAKMP